MAELKTKETDGDVLAFLDRACDKERKKDCLAILEMMREVTGEKPRMWGSSMVGFGKYRYKYESGREGEWFITGFSPRKNDLTIYAMTGFEAFKEMMDKLGKYKTGKSCLYVKKLEDVDTQVLRQLISGSVKMMNDKRA